MWCLFKLVLFTLVISYVESANVRKVKMIDEYEDLADIVYDERQDNAETNIRLNIKNLQLHIPEAQLQNFQEPNNNMMDLLRDSILKMFGIAPTHTYANEHTHDESLQINGNSVPAKYFLEISDFLLNNEDNEAIDDYRLETGKRNSGSFATEEYKIEKLENTNNMKNETIIISKLQKNNTVLRDLDKLIEMTSTHNKFSNNVTTNHTEKEDKFEQTRPIKLDTLIVTVAPAATTNEPKTLRDRVIWKSDN